MSRRPRRVAIIVGCSPEPALCCQSVVGPGKGNPDDHRFVVGGDGQGRKACGFRPAPSQAAALRRVYECRRQPLFGHATLRVRAPAGS